MKKLKSCLNHSVWAHIFFVMSPFFPGNNWLEITAIGVVVGLISPLFPDGINLGFIRSGLYFLYNIIAIVGLILLSKEKLFFRLWDWVSCLVAISILLLSGYIKEPLASLAMLLIGIYFLRSHLLKLVLYIHKKTTKLLAKQSNPKM